MKTNILLIFILILTLYSCNEHENNTLKKLVDKSLNSNVDVEKVFLGLKFGMSVTDFENELRILNQKEKIKPSYSGYSYEFIDNKKLKGINWIINSKLHNDSVIGIQLHSFKKFWKNNYNSIDDTYKEIINEYKLAYGKPSFIKNRFENYWIKDNLLISITKSNTDDLGGTIYISYDDKRKEKSIELTKCRFDENGYSLNQWYYDLKEKNKPTNKDI